MLRGVWITMTDASSNSNDGPGRLGNKVARLIDEYDMAGTAAELEHSWTAQGGNRRSLRELADMFNKQLLERYLMETGPQPLAGEIETLYSLLTDDDVSESERVRAYRRLERQDVDVEKLENEFVSYQTIRRYLKHHRGATYTAQETNRLEREAQNLQQLSGRVEAVTRNTLETLQNTSDLSLGKSQVNVNIRVYCEDCQTQHPVDKLLDSGGCDCE